jgi:hypothetical protein
MNVGPPRNRLLTLDLPMLEVMAEVGGIVGSLPSFDEPIGDQLLSVVQELRRKYRRKTRWRESRLFGNWKTVEGIYKKWRRFRYLWLEGGLDEMGYRMANGRSWTTCLKRVKPP